jgi:hypothetical protein
VTDGQNRTKTAKARVADWSDSDVDAPSGSTWNMAHGIAATTSTITQPTVHLFTVGEMKKATGGVSVWVVKRSDDDGQTWADVDDFQFDAAENAYAEGVYINTRNEIFVYGSAGKPLQSQYGVIRFSNDYGAHWTTLGTGGAGFQYNSYKDTVWNSFVEDRYGTYWVAGTGTDYLGKTHWIVQKSTNSGQSWTTVDDYSTAGPYEARGIVADSVGNVYVVGDGDGMVLVRRSADSGLNWRTDDFVLVANESCNVHTANHPIAVDSKNRVYYTYRCADSSTAPPIPGGVRMYDPDADAWALSDTIGLFLHSGNIYIDANDIVYIVGRVYDSQPGMGNAYWITKVSRDAGFSWQTLGRYQAAMQDAEPNGVWLSPSNGDLFVAGWAWNGSILYWVVRRLGP